MKRTKTKLISSITVLIVCFAMLIGSTFAWFTDSASTGVNKIQAGNLDVQLLAEDGTTSIEGRSLKWVKADGHTEEQVLWEPGTSYKLESFRIKNNGNLKLKYKINISGITGDALLLNVLDFVVEGVSSLTSLSNLNGFEGALEPSSTTEPITIKATMKQDAGNEYQGLSIENIGITVRATQLGGEFGGVNGENDSFNNTYDENATYPPLASYLNNTVKEAVTLDNEGKTGVNDTIISDGNATSRIPAATVIYGRDTNTPVATDDSGTLNRNIKTTASTSESVTYDISYNYVDTNGNSTPVLKFGNVVENVIDVSTGLEVVKVTHTHDDITREMVLADSKNAKEDGKYYYDSLDGKIYVWSSKYSEFKVDFKSDYAAATDGQGYATLQEAIDAVKDNGTVILLKDVTLTGDLPIGTENRNINLNLNAKTIDGGSYQVYTAGDGTIKIFGEGTIKNNNSESNTNTAALFIPTGSNAVLDGVSVEGNYGVYAFGNLTINEATINAVDCGIAVNGSAQVNVGTESNHNISVNASNGNCISTQAAEGSSDMVVNICGGAFLSSGTHWTMCPIYWASHGTLNIYGGSFVNSTTGTEAAGLYQKNGTVNIYDGTFESRCGLKLGAEENNSTEIEMNIYDGSFVGTNHAALYYKTATNGNNCTIFNINIFGGSFNGIPSKGSIYKSISNDTIIPSVSVTGGEFSSNPSEYVASNYEAVFKENGKWFVETYKVAYINGKGYETLNDAFADVNKQSTDTVTLYVREDITEELNDDYLFYKNLKIESLNGGQVTINLGFNYGNGSKLLALIPYYGHTLEIGNKVKITNLGQLFSGYNPTNKGDKLIINGEAYLQQLWAYGGGTIDINPAAKVVMGYGDGMIKMRYNSTINVTGEGNDADNMNLSGGYVSSDYSGNKTINLKDTYVKTSWVINSDDASGSFDIYLDNSTLHLTGGENTGLNLGTNSNNTIHFKNNSKIITKSCKNVDTLIIDVLGLSEERELVIDYQGSSNVDSDYYGQIDIINGDYHSEIIDNDLYVVKNS